MTDALGFPSGRFDPISINLEGTRKMQSKHPVFFT